jgi:alcohol dehydrogenase YqhD (iron-dependent ADH family)
MISFVYQNPTEIHFGKGVTEQLGETLIRVGIRKVLLVYGQGSIRRNGVYDRIMKFLKDQAVEVVEHGGVRGNPRLSHVREGIRKAQKGNVDGVLGVGGGSVIDAAKAIAAGSVASVDVWNFYTGRAQPERALPVAAVLTLPATGSEMNGISVVTDEETHAKNALVAPGILNPKVSFMDPEATLSLSPEQTAFACTDILSHIMEAYFTTSATRLPIQDNLIEGVARGTVEAMAAIQSDPADLDARASFMWSATLSWSGICQAGIPNPTMPCHALEMPMSAVYDMAHGAGLSVVIPAWITVAGDRYLPRISSFVGAVFGTYAETPSALAEIFRQYYRTIGSPVTFAQAGTPAPDIERLTHLASRAFQQRNMTDYTPEIIAEIYRACL